MMDVAIKAIIVDDETDACLNLKLICEKFTEGVQIVGIAHDVQGGKKLLENNPDINLVFLDISMPESSGFNLIETIDTDHQGVIFVTAHEEYALNAFKAKAWHYITKPIDIDELVTILKSVRARIQLIQSALQHEKSKESQIIVNNIHGFHLLDFKDIVSLEAQGNYCVFTMADNHKVISSKQLGHYEKLLSPHFFKVHRSFILNLHFVKGFRRIDGFEAIMTNGHTIPISRNHLKDFLNVIHHKGKV